MLRRERKQRYTNADGKTARQKPHVSTPDCFCPA
jgi:hypothetical protein